MENINRTPAVTQQAGSAMLLRSSGLSSGVMAGNAGTMASGSTITKSDPSASRMHSEKLTLMGLETDRSESREEGPPKKQS